MKKLNKAEATKAAAIASVEALKTAAGVLSPSVVVKAVKQAALEKNPLDATFFEGVKSVMAWDMVTGGFEVMDIKEDGRIGWGVFRSTYEDEEGKHSDIITIKQEDGEDDAKVLIHDENKGGTVQYKDNIYMYFNAKK